MVLSFPARPIGTRGIPLELEAGAQSGGGFCDPLGRRDRAAAGWLVTLLGRDDARRSIVDVRLTLLDERLDPAYVGDGRSGIVVGQFELRETAHFLAKESSPW